MTHRRRHVASVRLPPELAAEVRDLATLEERSFNAQLIVIVRDWLSSRRSEPAA